MKKKRFVWTPIVFAVGSICMVVALCYSQNRYDAQAAEKSVEKTIPISVKYRIINMKVTAYCPCAKCCGEFSDGVTSIGHDAKKTLGVAADPKTLPYKTELDIPGIGKRIVDDTGGAMRQSAKKGICHIDVRFHNHEDALKFGVRWLDVKVYNK